MKDKRTTSLETARLSKMIHALKSNPGGLWIRELARQTGLHSETVRRLVLKHPKIFVEYADFTKYGINLKIVKLRRATSF